MYPVAILVVCPFTFCTFTSNNSVDETITSPDFAPPYLFQAFTDFDWLQEKYKEVQLNVTYAIAGKRLGRGGEGQRA